MARAGAHSTHPGAMALIVFQLPHVPAVNRAALGRRIDISWRVMTDRHGGSSGDHPAAPACPQPAAGDARPLLPLVVVLGGPAAALLAQSPETKLITL